MSKALMEKLIISKSRELTKSETVLCATRYGNVMASRGSVIPLFFEQLKNFKHITVTNPKMTRFLMSLEESVQLVLHAFNNGKNGEIFVYKSPATTIENLAKAIIQIANINGKIKFIGTRHGEKLYESLVSQEEFFNTKDYGKFYKISPDNRKLDYDKFFTKGMSKNFKESYNSHNTKQLNVKEVVKKIKLLKSFDYRKYV